MTVTHSKRGSIFTHKYVALLDYILGISSNIDY